MLSCSTGKLVKLCDEVIVLFTVAQSLLLPTAELRSEPVAFRVPKVLLEKEALFLDLNRDDGFVRRNRVRSTQSLEGAKLRV